MILRFDVLFFRVRFQGEIDHRREERGEAGDGGVCDKKIRPRRIWLGDFIMRCCRGLPIPR